MISEPGPVYSNLLSGVSTVRHGVQEAWGQLKEVRTATEDFYQTGKAHSQGIILEFDLKKEKLLPCLMRVVTFHYDLRKSAWKQELEIVGTVVPPILVISSLFYYTNSD